MNNFGERLRLSLERAGYTQKEAALKVDVSKNSMNNYVNGRIPEARILYKLAKLCNTSMEWLLCGDEQSCDLELSRTGTDSTSKEASQKTNYIDAKHIKPVNSNYGDNIFTLTPDEHRLISLIKELPEKDRFKLEGYVEAMYSNCFENKKETEIYYTLSHGEDAATLVAEENSNYCITDFQKTKKEA